MDESTIGATHDLPVSVLRKLTERMGTCSTCGLKWEAIKPPADSPVTPEKDAYRKWLAEMLPEGCNTGPVRIVHCECDAKLIRPAHVEPAPDTDEEIPF